VDDLILFDFNDYEFMLYSYPLSTEMNKYHLMTKEILHKLL